MKPVVLSVFQAQFPLLPLSRFASFARISAQSGLGRGGNRSSQSLGFLVGVFITLLLFSNQIIAQDTLAKRPKIGLVLSGGGAKGLAHIGVLKVLEEAGVKIDYIGGTSMGAIVGGLYASGYTAQQMEDIFAQLDNDAILQDYISRESKNFQEKNYDERYAISLPFKDFKVGLPLSFSKGLYNYNAFNYLTRHVRHINDFNKLPIPFLCIATDIETGKQVLLNKGYLPQALAASSALPSLYAPIEIDGQYLIDGGVVNNYPIQEIKNLGADIIIGIDVQDDLRTRENLQDVTRMLVQITNLQMIQRMEKNRSETDIYIKPDIDAYSVISFDKGAEIIQKGVEAGRAFLSQFEALSGGFKNKTKINLVNDSLIFSEIRIPKLSNFSRAYIKGKLNIIENIPTTFNNLSKGIENLNATQNFSYINYTITNEKGGDCLNLFINENDKRSYLKFGLHYDDLYKSGLLANFTQKRLLFKNDALSVDFILGDNFRYAAEYYVDNGFYLSVGLRSKSHRFNRNLDTSIGGGLFTGFSVDAVNIDFIDYSHQLFLQTLFSKKFIIGGGVELRHLTIKTETFQTTNPVFDDSDYVNLFGYLRFDTFDNKYFPTKGFYINGEAKTYLYSSDYSQIFKPFSMFNADVGFARPIYQNLSFNFVSEVGFSVGPRSISYFDFILGGYGFYEFGNFKPFYGYDFLTLIGDSYIKAEATLDWQIFKRQHLNFSTNLANVGNRIFSNTDWIGKASFTGYALGYGLESVFGPIEIKHSWSPETGKHFTWFNIGFKF